MANRGSRIQTLSTTFDPTTLAATDGIDCSLGGWARSHLSCAAGEAQVQAGGMMTAYAYVVTNPAADGSPAVASDLRWVRFPGADWQPAGGARDELQPTEVQVQSGVRRIVWLPLGVVTSDAAASAIVGMHFRRNRA